MRTPRPYRWDLLPKMARGAVRLTQAAAAQWAPHRPEMGAWRAIDAALGGALGGAPVLEAGPVFAFPQAELEARLGTRPFVAVEVQRVADGRAFAIVVDGALAARLAGRVLGMAEELPGPRAASPAEQGVLAALVAAALSARDAVGLCVGGTVDEAAALRPLYREPWIVGLGATCRVGTLTGVVRIFAPESVLQAPAAAARPLADDWAASLDRVTLAVPLARGRATLDGAQIAALVPGDVVLLDDPTPRLVVGRGGITVALAAGSDSLTVTTSYQPAQGEPMPAAPDSALASDLPVELTCELARLRLTARELVELAPGAVLPLGQPLGARVELTAGGRVIARGELVDIEGELGFRLLEVVR